MAIIYGTPAILWPKPDTSEQWLLNSTVNPSYFGEDKTFNVEFTSNNTSYNKLILMRAANVVGYGDNTVVCSGGNMQDAYRQITLEKPATGDLLTWLEANAVRLPLTGTWVFNSTLSNVTTNLWGNANFTCNDALFKAMGYDPASRAFAYQASGGSGGSGVIGIYNLTDNVWSSPSYRTITFTSPVKYEGNEEFVKWFTANAKQLIVAKGTLINMDIGNGEKTYRVLENYYKGGTVQCLAMYNASISQKFNATRVRATMGSITVQPYSGSDLDTYLNTTWYNTLSATAKAAIISKAITQDAWYWSGSTVSGSPTYSGTSGISVPGKVSYSIGKYTGGTLTVGNRNIYALGVEDIINYLNDEKLRVDTSAILRNVNIWKMYWNVEKRLSSSTYPWLRSGSATNGLEIYAVLEDTGTIAGNKYSATSAVRPAFTIDLSKIPYSIPNVADVPTVTNTSFTYDGSVKSPTITGYDSSTMTISGTQSATSSGTYSVIFTLATGYMWSDLTTAPKTYSWQIDTADSSFELETTSITGIPGQTKYLKILSLSPSKGSFDFAAMDGNADVISAIAESAELIDGKRAIAITFNVVGTCQLKIHYSPRDTNYSGTSQFIDVACENADSSTLSGTWIFNDTLTPPENSFEVNASFSCPDSEHGDIDMTLIGCNIEYDPPYMYFGDGSNPAYNFSDNQWFFTNYQKIQFLSPFTGDTSFITWFMANATQQ